MAQSTSVSMRAVCRRFRWRPGCAPTGPGSAAHAGCARRASATKPDTLAEVFALDLQGRQLPAVGQPDQLPAGEVVGDFPDAADRVLHPHVPHDHPGLDHPQDQVHGADLEQRGGLGHVGVAHDHVQPPVELGVGVRLVPGVDDGPGAGGGGGDALPDVVRPLGEREGGPLRGARGPCPAPAISWRVTRNGMRISASRVNSPRRGIR